MTVRIPDVSKAKNFIYFPDSNIESGSFLGVPLIDRDGEVLGVLCAHKEEPGAFTESQGSLFEAVAENVAIAIDNALTFQRTQELMNRDALTNLYNRRYFFERFEKEIYRARRYGLHPGFLPGGG